MKYTEGEVESAVRNYVRAHGFEDLHSEIFKITNMFLRRTRNAPPSLAAAVSWAADRAIDNQGHYDHGTGAVR